MSRVLSIAGAKGGVGKTTTSLNLATALTVFADDVVLVETDLAMANLLDFVQLDYDPDTDPSLHDVLAGTVPIEETICSASGVLDVVPCSPSLDSFTATDPTKLKHAITALRERYDLIVMDSAAGLSYETVMPLALADAVVLVSTPRLAAVRDTAKTKQVTERLGTQVAGIVFCQSGTGGAPPPERIAEVIGVDLLGHVPDDDTVPASQDAGVPLIRYDFSAPAAKAYWEIARRLAGGPALRDAVGGRAEVKFDGGQAPEFENG